MTTAPVGAVILAAIDNSAAARPVLETAAAIAPFSGGVIRAFHVRSNGAQTVRAAAQAAGVELVETHGNPVKEIIEAARAVDVVAVVLGSRGAPGVHYVGPVPAAVLEHVNKPVVVVPPDVERVTGISRVLVPLETEPRTSRSLEPSIRQAREAHLDVVLLHVFDEQSLPRFSDHQYETETWIEEFGARYAPLAGHDVRIELRVGRPAETVLEVAREIGADLIAIGWSLDLSPGHATVVRTALEHSPVPLLLVPVDEPGDAQA